jgi:hypothetical protein
MHGRLLCFFLVRDHSHDAASWVPRLIASSTGERMIKVARSDGAFLPLRRREETRTGTGAAPTVRRKGGRPLLLLSWILVLDHGG